MGQYMVTHTDTSINGLQQQIRISQQQAATTWSTERISDQVTATTSHTVSGTAPATSGSPKCFDKLHATRFTAQHPQ